MGNRKSIILVILAFVIIIGISLTILIFRLGGDVQLNRNSEKNENFNNVVLSNGFEIFNSKEGRFSVLMPQNPRKEIIQGNSEIGTINIYTYQSSYNGLAYLIGYADYPKEAIDSALSSNILDEARDGAVKNIGGKLTAEELITLDGYPGRSFNVEIGENGFMRMRIYLAENRAYFVEVVGQKGTEMFSYSAEDFFNSFSLTN